MPVATRVKTITTVTLILAVTAVVMGLVSLIWIFAIQSIPPASTVLAIDEVSTTVPAKTSKNIVLHVSHPTGRAEVYVRGTKTPIHRDLTALHVDGAIHTIEKGSIAPGTYAKGLDAIDNHNLNESVYNPYANPTEFATHFNGSRLLQNGVELSMYQNYRTWQYVTKAFLSISGPMYFHTIIKSGDWGVISNNTRLANPSCTVHVNSSEISFVTKGDEMMDITKRKISGKLLHAYNFSSQDKEGYDITAEVQNGVLQTATNNNTIVLVFVGLLETV